MLGLLKMVTSKVPAVDGSSMSGKLADGIGGPPSPQIYLPASSPSSSTLNLTVIDYFDAQDHPGSPDPDNPPLGKYLSSREVKKMSEIKHEVRFFCLGRMHWSRWEYVNNYIFDVVTIMSFLDEFFEEYVI